MQPVALFMGRDPGWRCNCQWATVTKAEFREMFGKSFSEMRFVTHPNTFWAYSKGVGGNAKQRRKARRAGQTVVVSQYE